MIVGGIFVYTLMIWLDAIMIVMLRCIKSDAADLFMKFTMLFLAFVLRVIVFETLWIPALFGIEIVAVVYEWNHAEQIYSFLRKIGVAESEDDDA